MSQHLVGYVINLARQPERLEKFYRQAPARFFQTVSAVDRKNLELLDLNLVFDLASCERKIHRLATAGGDWLHAFAYALLEKNRPKSTTKPDGFCLSRRR